MKWQYLFGMLFVGMIDMMWTSFATDAHSSFMFVVIFMLPPMFDLKRGHPGLMLTLPLSRRTAAHYYWVIIVLLPTLAVAGVFIVAGLLSACFFSAPSFATLLASFAVVVLAALLWASASSCLITYSPPMAPEEANYFAWSWMLLWLPTVSLGMGFSDQLDIARKTPVVWLATAMLGILLAGWSFRRSERLVLARVTVDRGDAAASVEKPERRPPFQPGAAGFGGWFFFEVARNSFLMNLLFPGLLLAVPVLGARFGVNPSMFGANSIILPWMFAFCTLGFSDLLAGGVRMLRILPMSVGQLALILLLVPLGSILGMICALAAFGNIYPGHLFGPHPASFLIPMGCAVCLVSTLYLPYGGPSNRFIVLSLAMLVSFVVLTTIPDVKCPAVIWWLLGLALIVSAFFLNRHWLRRSDSYRPGGGSFSRR
jgi:hypothetical protein